MSHRLYIIYNSKKHSQKGLKGQGGATVASPASPTTDGAPAGGGPVAPVLPTAAATKPERQCLICLQAVEIGGSSVQSMHARAIPWTMPGPCFACQPNLRDRNLSYVCSHVGAIIGVFSHPYALICALICVRIALTRVLSYACSHTCVLPLMYSHMCASLV